LTEADLVGAVKDIYGKPIMKEGGGFYDHLGEVNDALKGLGNQLSSLRKQIDSGSFDGDALKSAESLFKQLQDKKDNIQSVLNKAKKAAAESQ